MGGVVGGQSVAVQQQLVPRSCLNSQLNESLPEPVSQPGLPVAKSHPVGWVAVGQPVAVQQQLVPGSSQLHESLPEPVSQPGFPVAESHPVGWVAGGQPVAVQQQHHPYQAPQHAPPMAKNQGFGAGLFWGGYGSGSENFFPGAGSGTSPAPEDEDKAFLHIF